MNTLEALDLMLMTVIAIAHEAITDDTAWAALVARTPGLAGQREELHDAADLTGAVHLAAMLDEAGAVPASAGAAPESFSFRVV
jgi:hypothetical protein